MHAQRTVRRLNMEKFVMFRQLLIVIALLAAATTATAESSQEKGFYLVGAAGQSTSTMRMGSFGSSR